MGNIVIQYPTATLETIVLKQQKITPIQQFINRKLIFLTVMVPENGIIKILNNNVQILYFVGETTITLPMPDGLAIENLAVEIWNNASINQRFSLNMVFE